MRKMPGTYPSRLPAALLAATLLLVPGCGSGDSSPRPRRAGTLTIYSSLPRQGISARQADAVAAGERLALADAGSRAGGRRVRLVELDSSSHGDAPWDPAAVEENARRATKDDSAVAYLGELDFGASAVSVPVTNSATMLQVSPEDGLPSLTTPDPGGGGEIPARYYPKGERTLVRVVPHDGHQARVAVSWASDDGARSIAIVRDNRVDSREAAAWAIDAAMDEHLPIAQVQEARSGESDYAGLVRKVAARKPGAVIYTGLGGPTGDRLFAELEKQLPGVPRYATGGVAPDPPATGTVRFVDSVAPAAAYRPAARRVLRRLEARSGAPVSAGALYGYEAMRIALDAIDSARPTGDRKAIVRAALGSRRDGVLGTYSISAGGDVAGATFASYESVAGRVRFLGLRSAGE